MAALGENFSIGSLPGAFFAPIPAGWYDACISQTNVKETKSGTGTYIAIMFTITGPAFGGRSIWTNINIRNTTAIAEEIGRQQLGSLMTCIGLESLSDSDQLIGASVGIRIAHRPATGSAYDGKEEVKGFRPSGTTSSNAPFAPPPSVHNPSPTAASRNDSTPPWAK